MMWQDFNSLWDWGIEGMIIAGVVFILAIIIYFLPSFVASNRHHPNGLAIFLVNLLLGWTLLGWVGALVWACINPSPPPREASSALDIAKTRYARGEISQAEFEAIKRNIF
jgi:uncharacterized membrane protein